MRIILTALMGLATILYSSCNLSTKETNTIKHSYVQNSVELMVLGTIQDAGSPQIGCRKSCCINLWEHPDPTRMVVSLGIVDHRDSSLYLFEATPDIGKQMEFLSKQSQIDQNMLKGIFVTHAHIGHYTGLMHLGREASGAKNVPVYTMPRMATYLTNNGPWSQLISQENIVVNLLKSDSTIHLNERISITPMLVPHRDEYSETVGYKIQGPRKSLMFIPDIDKWARWDRNILTEIKSVDYAFLDATFYSGVELNNRDMSEIPHPSIQESMGLFESLDSTDKAKVNFIHFNHTNPVLNAQSSEFKKVHNEGYNIAKFGDRFHL